MIEFQNVSKAYDRRIAVAGLSLRIERGEFCVLVGPSGSGKSTTLRLINRLIEPDSGRILVNGEDIGRTAPEELRRRMGYAIQSVGLFPHWTVAENIAAVPRLLNWPKARIARRVAELLDLLGLDPILYRDRYPNHLSGGQQQRVGVARALAADPELLLMDEPFGALDPITRSVLQTEMRRIHQALGRTIVMVTHDIDEALTLASRIVLFDHGRIAQAGSPLELLARPADGFVADFLGRDDLALRRLSLETVADRIRPGEIAPGEAISASLTLRRTLSVFLERGVERLAVAGNDGRPLGTIHLSDVMRPSP